MGDTSFTVYNQWSVDVTSLEAGSKYNLEGMGSIYNQTAQLYLISFVKGETGIDAVKAQNAAQQGVMYNNVAGQVVNKGYKGLVIINGKKFVNK